MSVLRREGRHRLGEVSRRRHGSKQHAISSMHVRVRSAPPVGEFVSVSAAVFPCVAWYAVGSVRQRLGQSRMRAPHVERGLRELPHVSIDGIACCLFEEPRAGGVIFDHQSRIGSIEFAGLKFLKTADLHQMGGIRLTPQRHVLFPGERIELSIARRVIFDHVIRKGLDDALRGACLRRLADLYFGGVRFHCALEECRIRGCRGACLRHGQPGKKCH